MVSHPGFELWVGAPQPVAFTTPTVSPLTRKGVACPHCLEDTAVWLRHSKKYVFIGHRHFLGKKYAYQAMDCQFNGEKNDREALLHVTRDLIHFKVKDIKTIKELPKLLYPLVACRHGTHNPSLLKLDKEAVEVIYSLL
jgi:hypothetical protein